MVGERGFEPPTPWSRTRCSTRLSHSPMFGWMPASRGFLVAPGRFSKLSLNISEKGFRPDAWRMNSAPHFDLSRIHVLDGGLATELERRGCDISGPLWSARVLDEAPEAIQQVHFDYLRAGADCISTASYQVSAMGYGGLGRSCEDADRALRKSVELAEAAREEYRRESDRPVLIAA